MDNALLPARRPSVIRLTSLIDLLFVLLLFFMLTTSFIREKQLELAAPVASSAATASKPQRLLLGVAGDLAMFGTTASLDDEQLKGAINTSHPVVLLPAADAEVQTLVSAMTRLKALGFNQLSLGKPVANAPASATTGETAHAAH